jgi:HD-GYP domain-containing protein (c-di-GMP phosphodiesterase class II)
MRRSPHKNSIFSQALDRTTFIAYFLGAIIPLLALAVVVQRFVLPTLSARGSFFGMISLVSSIALLSLVSFQVLRRATRQTLERIDRDNKRLASLLGTSTSLTASEHASDIATTAVSCAAELTEARAAYLLVRGKGEDMSAELFGSAGEGADELFQSVGEPLVEVAELVMRHNRPAFKTSGSDSDVPGLEAAMVLPLAGESEPLGALVVVHTDSGAYFESGQTDAITTLAGLVSVALRNADLRDSQRNFFSHMTEILVSALDAHLEHQAGHGNRVARNANRLGRSLELNEKQLHDLHFASLLHDIGMLKIEKSLHANPKLREKHVELGYRMLGRIRLWDGVAPIIHSHHEWYDGNGYAEGLSGDAIPLESRIIAICDAFDSMVSATSYQAAVSVNEAVEELRRGAGTQFDPKLVEVFLALAERGEISE